MNLSYNNATIFYRIEGTGPALILLHGFLESSTMWSSTIKKFKQTHTVITIDLPGHGKSGVLAEKHSMELMAMLVAKILAAENIMTASFIGHSMGGYVALAFAKLFPDHIEKLIVLNASTYKDNDDRKVNRNRAIKLLKTQKQPIISMAISTLFTDKERLDFASEITKLKKEAMQFPSEGIIATIKGMRDRKDSTAVLEKFAGSKLLIAGKSDTIVPIWVSEEISEKTKTPLKIINGGHMSWITNNTEMLNFMHFID